MEEYSGAVQRVGARIRDLRQSRGMTQKELAEKAGVFDVGELERGYKVKGGVVNPRLETLCRIADALGVGLEEIFGVGKLEEEVVEIKRLLEGQSEERKRQAVRLVEVCW